MAMLKVGTRTSTTRSRGDELLLRLAELTGDLSADLSPLEAGRQVLRRGLSAVGAGGGIARVVDSRGIGFDIVDLGSAPIVPAPAAEALRRGHECWLSSVEAVSAMFPGSATAGVGALVCVHVERAGKRIGALALWFAKGSDFTSSDQSFVRAFARILVQEVDRASLDEARHTVERWQVALRDAFRLIAMPASSPERILDELARVSCEVPADFSAIRVLSPDRRVLEYRGLHHRDPVEEEDLRWHLEGQATPAELGLTARVLETGISLLLPEVDMDRVRRVYAGTPFAAYIAERRMSTVMVVPLRSQGAVFGVLVVARVDPPPFVEADLRFLEEVADRAALAIDNANMVQKLARSEELLRVALEAGRLGAWEWDVRTDRVTWSAMLENIHGWANGTFEGTFEAYRRDIHPEDRERVLATVSRVVEERIEHYLTYRIIRPDGEVRWLEAHGKLLCDPGGAPLRLVGVCTDITDRKRAEEQLQETLLALRDADKRKDQFLSMLAHELRNPLGPMLNATYLLGNAKVGPDTAARARAILDRQVRQMARLLDDLLDVSRITRGKITLDRETVDVGALTREVIGDHAESFRSGGLTLDLTVSAEPLFVHADRTRLAQVIGNLLSNALKFSGRGKSVRVRADRDNAGRSAVLTVQDEGVGIKPALLGRMFEPFEQGDASLARERGGLGLGLAVVKGLVTLHGGRVSATSDGPGRGAEVRVELPLRGAEDDVSTPTSATPDSSRGSCARVLIFEDNADAAESLRGLLAAAGYHVAVEASGSQALEVARRFRPDTVLCDLGLPDRDGFAVARDIRSDRDLSHLTLIAISGYGTQNDQSRSLGAGFDLHLTKPVPPAVLLDELSRRDARRAEHSRLPSPHAEAPPAPRR
jgi:PAS domain S-box-containing protein